MTNNETELEKHSENKVYDNCNKVSYLQKNKKCYSLETTFQKKVNFAQ